MNPQTPTHEKLLKAGLKRGVIESFSGSHMSGIAFLTISGKSIPCDNAPTVRALEQAYGNIIQPDHSADISSIIGKEIYFKMDDMDLLLEGFIPVEELGLEDID